VASTCSLKSSSRSSGLFWYSAAIMFCAINTPAALVVIQK
jgi:hypothetical protein